MIIQVIPVKERCLELMGDHRGLVNGGGESNNSRRYDGSYLIPQESKMNSDKDVAVLNVRKK